MVDKGKWVPKLTMVVEKCSLVEDQSSSSRTITTKDRTIVINSRATNPTIEPPQLQKSSSDSGFDHLTIKERAFLIQFQVFGMSSIRHSFFSKDEDDCTSQVKLLQGKLPA